MVKVKARFVFDVVVDIKDTKGFDPEEIVMKQVTGQLNVGDYGAFDLTYKHPIQTSLPEDAKVYVEPEALKLFKVDGASILAFVENYQKTYGEHPYSVELERHIRFNEPKPNVEKIIFIANSYRHKYGFDDYLTEVMTYYNLELDDNLNLKENHNG